MVSSFLNKRLFQKVEPYLYLLPALIVILTFTYYPFLQNVINSTYIVNAAGLRKNFVGLENYRKILTNPVFLQAIKNTIIFAACTIPLSLIVGLILALIAREKTSVIFITNGNVIVSYGCYFSINVESNTRNCK